MKPRKYKLAKSLTREKSRQNYFRTLQKVNGDTVSVLLLDIAVSHTPNPNITEIQGEKTIQGVNTTFPVKGNLKAVLCEVTWPGISWVAFLE